MTKPTRRRVGRLPVFVAVALALTAWPASGQDVPVPELPVTELTLDNGLRLLVLPRAASPTVAFVVQYAVGGVNEALGSTGTAHLLEHMLFKGTTTLGTRDLETELGLFENMDVVNDSILAELAELGPDSIRVARLEERVRSLETLARAPVVSNEFDRILTRNGARNLNATTSSEATTYFVELPANRVKLWFLLKADRARNPVFREFYSERDGSRAGSCPGCAQSSAWHTALGPSGPLPLKPMASSAHSRARRVSRRSPPSARSSRSWRRCGNRPRQRTRCRQP